MGCLICLLLCVLRPKSIVKTHISTWSGSKLQLSMGFFSWRILGGKIKNGEEFSFSFVCLECKWKMLSCHNYHVSSKFLSPLAIPLIFSDLYYTSIVCHEQFCWQAFSKFSPPSTSSTITSTLLHISYII